MMLPRFTSTTVDESGNTYEDQNDNDDEDPMEDCDQDEQGDWLLMPPFQRLEKICNHPDVFKRQLVGRTVPDALLSVSESPFDVARVLLIINKISEDPEVNVRLDLVDHIPHICMTCQEYENTKLYTLVLSNFLPLNLKFLSDRELKVRKAAQKSLIVLLENDIFDSNVIETVICQHVLSLTELNEDIYTMSAVELMSTMAPLIGHELTEQLFIPKLVALSSSDTPNVRYTCAASFGDFCAVASQPVIEKLLLPNFVKLTSDTLWNVRKACANVIMSVSCACSLETRKSILAPIFARLLNDENKWVRLAAFQYLGPFITTFAQPSITGLAYNNEGELVLVNPEGFEFKCPTVSQTVNCLVNSMDSMANMMKLIDSQNSNNDNKNQRLFHENNCLLDKSNTASTTLVQDSDVDENFNYFQYWREPIPIIPDEDTDFNNQSSNLLKLSNSIDNLNCLVGCDDKQDTSYDASTKETTDEDETEDWGESCDSLASNDNRAYDGDSDYQSDYSRTANRVPSKDETVQNHTQQIVPQELIDYYVTMFQCGNDATENSDLAHHCAFSLPAVALTLGSSNWCLLKSVCKQLAADEHWKVRRMVASSIHELAVIVGADAATEDLLPVYSELIKDLDEVRIGALRILSRFLFLLKPEGRIKFLPLFNMFLLTEYESNWRFRAEFAEQLGQSLCFFSPQDTWDYLAPLALSLLQDKVSAVRKEAIHLIYLTMDHLSKDSSLLRMLLSELAEKFAHSSHWHHRQTFALVCAKFAQNYFSQTFACDLLPHLLDLSLDRVPNVRLCVAKTLSEEVLSLPYFKNPSCPHNEVLMTTLVRLMSDLDPDVRYYATLKQNDELSTTSRAPTLLMPQNRGATHQTTDEDKADSSGQADEDEDEEDS